MFSKRGKEALRRIFCDHEGLITSSLVIALITHIHHVTTQTHAYMNILLASAYEPATRFRGAATLITYISHILRDLQFKVTANITSFPAKLFMTDVCVVGEKK